MWIFLFCSSYHVYLLTDFYNNTAQQVRMARVMQLNKAAYDAYTEQQEKGCSNAEEDPDATRNEEETGVEDLEGDPDPEGGQRTLFSQISRIYDGSKTPYNYTILQSAYRVCDQVLWIDVNKSRFNLNPC